MRQQDRLVEAILDQYGDRVPITGLGLVTALKRGDSDTILRLLPALIKWKGRQEIGDTVLEVVLGSERLRPSILAFLLKLLSSYHGDRVAAIQRVLKVVPKAGKRYRVAAINDLTVTGLGYLIPVTSALILRVKREARRAKWLEGKLKDVRFEYCSDHTGKDKSIVGTCKLRWGRATIKERVLAWIVNEHRRRTSGDQEQEWGGTSRASWGRRGR
ncbi:hypothetical protein OQA88_7446 [Cercophora sp. LCS_1]